MSLYIYIYEAKANSHPAEGPTGQLASRQSAFQPAIGREENL